MDPKKTVVVRLSVPEDRASDLVDEIRSLIEDFILEDYASAEIIEITQE